MSEILNIARSVSYDNNISKMEYHTYSPYLHSFEPSDVVHICIQQQDLCVLPSESYIYIEGGISLVKADSAGNIISSTATLANNAIAFLFDEIVYELNGFQIDSIKNAGITSTLKNYISLNLDEGLVLQNAAWSPNEPILPAVGTFNFCVPLKMLLGFAEDYKKVIVNARHELKLIRSRTNNNAVVSLTDTVQVNIYKLQWRVPHVTLADSAKLSLIKSIQSNPIQISFRSWELYEYPTLASTTDHIWTVKTTSQLEKPRYIILALQTKRKNDQKKDVSKFDHCDLSDVKVFLNSESYPNDNLNLDFGIDRFALLYEMYIKFRSSYYNSDIPSPLSRSDLKKMLQLW